MSINRDLMHANILIKLENDRQLEKWGDRDLLFINMADPDSFDILEDMSKLGTRAKKLLDNVNNDPNHTDWANVLIEEVGEFIDAARSGNMQHVKTEIIQVAAVAKMIAAKL